MRGEIGIVYKQRGVEMVSRFAMTMALSALAFGAWAEAPKG